MEINLQSVAKEALNQEKVCGYLCSDDNGLCLASSGIGDKALCPTMVKVSQLASQLSQVNKESLVVSIDSDDYKIYIKSAGPITTALYKKY